MRFLVFLTVIFLIHNIAVLGNSKRHSIIPIPVSMSYLPGECIITNSFKVGLFPLDVDTNKLAHIFCENMPSSLNVQIQTIDSQLLLQDEAVSVNICINKNNRFPSEGYELIVSSGEISINASTSVGAFWAIQTLQQLMEKHVSHVRIPCVKILDYPRFAYRGLHLDVARHMFSVEFIKKYIDLMSKYKLNKFHWHLTDDQGWRIEIKKYPRLQEIAAYRNATLVGHLKKKHQVFDQKRYGGYYTQEEIKEIVQYASDRKVTIIPEIDLPGHALSVLAAYPHLGCEEKNYQTGTKWGIFDDVFCAGNDEVFTFLENVLDEVLALFPSKLIHIGGDEVLSTKWKSCSKCQSRVQSENLGNESKLQDYFMNKLVSYLKSKNRKAVGWDEILNNDLNPEVLIMSWRGESGGILAANTNRYAIMTPSKELYFDKYQSTNSTEPLAIGGLLPLKRVYLYDPIPDNLDEKKRKYILGAQANVWTEYMKSESAVEYMAFPRALALSEVVWSQKSQRDYTGFINRLIDHFPELNKMNINYRCLEQSDF
ncbi:beta-N-acetylglucosaminidase [Candidatus Aerophobetes bacterium]|uniref:beta-N-acetylhexosaminidase n=1 Tax=Aerophobetes bacterium TaxID=2030807 RepID=A0A2A4YF29_UNCAE|nr:MAG: beta-N-acetylglucosaminidase [Candidatus Aerophobetes bacterium]